MGTLYTEIKKVHRLEALLYVNLFIFLFFSPELIAVMLNIGNKVLRELWEAQKPKNHPIHSSSQEDREKFIKAKYLDKEFLVELPRSTNTVSEVIMT